MSSPYRGLATISESNPFKTLLPPSRIAFPAILLALTIAPVFAQTGSAEKEGPGAPGAVRIHGHWVIEVKDPDGTIRGRREFENSYVGGTFMPFLLAGRQVMTDPFIFFYGQAANILCGGLTPTNHFLGAPGIAVCTIVNNTAAGEGTVFPCPGGICYGGLNVSLTPSGNGYSAMVLSASIAAQNSGDILYVGTAMLGCQPALAAPPATAPISISSNQCYTNAGAYSGNTTGTGDVAVPDAFTATQINDMSVITGQIITFQVTLTFA